MAFLESLHPVVGALLATMFTWALTAVGASVSLVRAQMSRKLLDGMLGFAAGVMLAASYWSLLAPAIEMAETRGGVGWVPAALGFLGGAAFLRLADALVPHLHPSLSENVADGPASELRPAVLMVLAVTLHNIPEGLAVGVAFGAANGGAGVAGIETASVAGAAALALGIGIQNFPEGMAVALPLRRAGLSPWASFMWGQFSAVVEIIAGVLGAALVMQVASVLPYALAFAAGAMVFVVAEDLIPEAQSQGNTDIATIGVILGFTVMMVLDVAFG
ncbi:MAG: ZIP family metal transporter [Bacillota bacterium]|nr:ZIP family metal transporter [Bacillota bacterium]